MASSPFFLMYTIFHHHFRLEDFSSFSGQLRDLRARSIHYVRSKESSRFFNPFVKVNRFRACLEERDGLYCIRLDQSFNTII